MVDPDKPGKKFIDKIKEDERLNRGYNYFWNRRIEFLTGPLMLIGIILSFFYMHLGGVLVGLAFGICFFEEIQNYFIQLRERYSSKGLFKTLMLIGVALYFLLSIPTFIIFAIIGFAVIYLIRRTMKNR